MAAQGLHVGAMAGPQTVYDLGQAWYATRLDQDWQPADPARASEIFARHGLTGAFWSLD